MERGWAIRVCALPAQRSSSITVGGRGGGQEDALMPYGVNPETGRPGPTPKTGRDGDKLQARARVNALVKQGILLHPNKLPCTDCGHRWKKEGDRRHEYDHHKGYAAKHHLTVEPVCRPCHCRRAIRRGEIKLHNLRRAARRRSEVRKLKCSKGHAMTRMKDGMWRCYTCRLAYFKRYNRKRYGRTN